jgi:hypothetical protein
LKTTFTNPKTAAVVSLVLILPGALLLLMLFLGIEPPLGPLEPLLNAPQDQPDILGTAIALTMILILPLAAMVINLTQIQRSRREDNRQPVNFANWALVAASLLLILLFVGGIIVDQYPCWTGVPNCD